MDRGTYTAASGGLFQMRRLEVLNNNLANINTPGFKKQVMTGQQQTFDQTLASQMNLTDPYAKGDQDRTPGVVNLKTATDFSAGPVRNTGNPLDVALRNPNDFFVINTPAGQQYTRAGDFTTNSAGELVTQDGFTVLGDGGSLTLDGPGAQINADGSVFVNRERVGALSVVHVDDPSTLERMGSSRFALKTGSSAPNDVDPEVVPQSLEMSNVSAISGVVDLITTQRAFMAYTKSAESIDSLNQVAINQVGKSR